MEEVRMEIVKNILRCDFVWLVSPDGYIGESVAFEIGLALSDPHRKVRCTNAINNYPLQSHITQCSTIQGVELLARWDKAASLEKYARQIGRH